MHPFTLLFLMAVLAITEPPILPDPTIPPEDNQTVTPTPTPTPDREDSLPRWLARWP